MTLLSVLEDFLRNTLGAMPGRLARLQYIAGLRDEKGRYSHWGLARVHGRKSAEPAIAEAHKMVVLDILKTPLQELAEETPVDSEGKITELASLSDPETLRRLQPNDLGGGSARHFNSVLHALSKLARNRSANRPTS